MKFEEDCEDEGMDPHMKAKEEILQELIEMMSGSMADRIKAKKKPPHLRTKEQANVV